MSHISSQYCDYKIEFCSLYLFILKKLRDRENKKNEWIISIKKWGRDLPTLKSDTDMLMTEVQRYEDLTASRSLKSDKLIIDDLSNDFHNSNFDITFEDVMMFDLQNIHDDSQTKPLIHQDFENMR